MAKDKIQKTNVARLLERAGIHFELIPYEVDENDLAAQHVADQLGEDISRVFKTLVLKGEYPGRNSAASNAAGHFVCVVPGDAEVDLKKAARAAGAKKADLIPMKELLPLTGYIRGGCSPVGMKKPFPTFYHLTATDFPEIYVSAGVRGLQLKIRPADLIAYTNGTVADLTTDNKPSEA
jgi:ybaK/ebsC protein